jgi:hypothetical protein
MERADLISRTKLRLIYLDVANRTNEIARARHPSLILSFLAGNPGI